MGLRAFLEGMVWCHRAIVSADYEYDCFEDFVLDRGRDYHSHVMDAETMAVIDSVPAGPYPQRECYANAQRFVLMAEDDRFVYVEGFVSGAVIPVLHGWVEVDGEVVFDPTLRLCSGPYNGRDVVYGSWPENEREYMGVRFPDRDAIRRRVLRLQEYSSIIDDWRGNWPLLKEARREPKTLVAPGYAVPGRSS